MTSDTSPQITSQSWLMVGLLGLVWGATFLFMEIALRGVTPFWLAAYRIGFAAALTLGVWRFTGGRLWLSEARAWPALGIVGLLSTAVPFMLLSWGLQYVTSGFAGVCMAAVALMVLPLAHVFVPGERMTARRLAGFVTGFVGVALLIGPEAFASSGEAMELWGRLACLGAAGCYAISSVMMRRLPPADPIGLSAMPLLVGSALVIPMAFLREGAPVALDSTTLLVVAVLGLLPTAGANLLRVLVIRSAGPVFMTLVNYMVPVWSVGLGIAILGEPARPTLFVALALILSGVFVSQWGALKRLFSK